MKGSIQLFGVFVLAVLVGTPHLLAQPGAADSSGAASAPGTRMTGQGSSSQAMPEHHQQMMQEHQKMLSEMKAMDADVDKKVAAMNAAQGTAKVDAMAEVINALVKERQVMRQHMTEMQERMMTHPHHMQPHMGGTPSGQGGGGGSGSSSQPSKE